MGIPNEGRGFDLSRRSLMGGTAAFAGASALSATVGASATAASAQSAPRLADTGSGDADLALVNGHILTMDGSDSIASAVAIRGGRIVEVGRNVGKATRTIDLKGATVIPGLIDAHAHIYWTSANPGYEARDIELAKSIPEILRALTERSKTVPRGQFITCNGGWARRQLAEKRLPTLAELDRAVPDHPVWIAEMMTEDNWIDPVKHPPLPAVVNSAGLAFFRQAGVQGDAKTGQIDWVATTAALQKAQSEADVHRNFDDAIDYMVAHGLTMLQNKGGGIDDGYLINLWREERLKLRFRLRLFPSGGGGLENFESMMTNTIDRLGDDVLRLNGFAGIGGDRASFIEIGKAVAKRGWLVHNHSVTVNQPGDIAEHVEHTEIYEAVNAAYPLKDLRWQIAHGNYLTPELIQRLKAMNVGVEGDAWQYCEPKANVPMGPPWRTLLDSGIKLGGGSDCTGTCSANPWLTIAYMCTGKLNTGEVGNPGQNLTRMEALKVHTLGSAWFSFDENDLGSVETGKLADLVVLSDDPLTTSEDGLRKIKSTMTLQGGKVVHQAA